MPQFKIAKTMYVNNLPAINNGSEDTLYIVKNKNKFGELYYDYSNGNRIKLSESNQIYKYNEILNNPSVVNISNLQILKFNINGNEVSSTSQSISGTSSNNNMFVNQFVLTNNGVGIITDINDTKISLVPFYVDNPLQWVDV